MHHDDLSNRQTASPSTIPLTALKKHRRGLLASAAAIYKRVALAWAGYDDAELLAKCSPGEKNSAIVRGTLVMLNIGFLSGAFSFIGHYLAHSSFSPMIVLGAIFLAVFLGLADHYVMVRAAAFPTGMRNLLHGGFPIDVPIGDGATTRACVKARGFITLLIAAVIALFAGLYFNDAAISRRLATNDLQRNITLAQRAAKAQEGKREIAEKRYQSSVATEQALATENDRLVKQANRTPSNASSTKLSSNEARLATARAAVADRKHELDVVDANRAGEIAAEMKQSPLYIPTDDSLIARIRALLSEIHSNVMVAVPLVMIDAVIMSFDLIILTVLKGISMPSTYCMEDTRQHLSAMVRQARLAESETTTAEAISGGDNKVPSNETPDHPPGGQPAPRPPMPRGGPPLPPRPRGRPRTNHLNSQNGEISHD